MLNIRSVPSIVKSVVDMIRENESYENDAPYFDFGHHSYIATTLDLKSKSTSHQDKVWPFIGLILDIPQDMYPNDVSETDADLNIVIASPTNRDMIPSEQESDIFIPILIPLYEYFLKWMYQSAYLNVRSEQIPHRRIDHYLYNAAEGQNKWNANVCAIELNFTGIEFKKIICNT